MSKMSRYAIKRRLKRLLLQVLEEPLVSREWIDHEYAKHRRWEAELGRPPPFGRTEELAAKLMWLEGRFLRPGRPPVPAHGDSQAPSP